MDGIYYLNSKFESGIYKGYDLGLIYVFNAAYIDFLIQKHHSFCVWDIDELSQIPIVNEKVEWPLSENPEMIDGLNLFDSYQEMVDNVRLGSKIHKFTQETKEINNQKRSKYN